MIREPYSPERPESAKSTSHHARRHCRRCPGMLSGLVTLGLLCLLTGCGRREQGTSSQSATAPSKAPAPPESASTATEASILHIKNKADFEQRVLNAQGLFLVDFYADWCPPCKMLAPVLEELSAEMGGALTIVKVDVDGNRELAQQYKVRSIPLLLLITSGKVAGSQLGYRDKADLKAWIEKAQTDK